MTGVTFPAAAHSVCVVSKKHSDLTVSLIISNNTLLIVVLESVKALEEAAVQRPQFDFAIKRTRDDPVVVGQFDVRHASDGRVMRILNQIGYSNLPIATMWHMIEHQSAVISAHKHSKSRRALWSRCGLRIP